MSDQAISTAVEASTTPATTESVETTDVSTPTTEEKAVETSKPFDNGDPWAGLGEETEEKSETEPAASETDKTDDAAKKAEEPAKTEEKDEKSTDGDEKPLEDKVLEELFADESEKKEESKEEDLDKQDPEKMIAGQRNATARAWAERRDKKATIVDDFQFPQKATGAFKPIAEVAATLKDQNTERYVELSRHAAHELVDANPDATFQRAYAVKMLSIDPNWNPAKANIPTLDDLIRGNVTGSQTTTETTASEQIPELAELTAELDKALDFDWRDPANDGEFTDERERQLASTLRAMEAKVKAEVTEKTDLKTQLEKLNKDVEDIKATKIDGDQTAIKTSLNETMRDYRGSIEEKILPFITKNAGLEISKNDTPEISQFKQRKLELYTGTEYERANGLDSAFETFAYNESSVKKELEDLITRVIDIQVKESNAKISGKTADAAKYHAEAEEERVPLMTLLSQANKEFKERYITPDFEMIGKFSSNLAAPLQEASERQEIVSNGSGVGSSQPKKVEHATADDVWGSMVTEAEQEERLRASA